MDLCWKTLDGQKHGSEQDIRKNVEGNCVWMWNALNWLTDEPVERLAALELLVLQSDLYKEGMFTGTGEVPTWIIRASSRPTLHPFHKEVLTFIHRVIFQDFWKCSMRRDQNSSYWTRAHSLCVLTSEYRAKAVCIEQLTFIFTSWLQLTANQRWVIQKHKEMCILSFVYWVFKWFNQL